MTKARLSISLCGLALLGILALLAGTVADGPNRRGAPVEPEKHAEPGVPQDEPTEPSAEPTAAIEGVVESAITAKPIDGALVEVTAEGAKGPVGAQRPLVASVRSTTDGSFRIDAAPTLRILTVTVSARGFLPRRHDLVLRPDAEAPHRIHSRLDPGGVLTGSVYDPDGKPVAGATVYVVSATMVFQFNVGTGWMNYYGYVPAARTDAEGNYEVFGIPLDGHYRAMAKKPPWVVISAYNAPGLYLDRRDPVRRLDFTLKRYGTAVVHLFGPGGSPVTDATFHDGFTHLGWDLPAKVKVDGPGIYRFERIRPGHFPLYVVAPPFAAAEIGIEVAEDRTKHVSMHLDHGLTAEGVVVDDRGRPVVDAQVRTSREIQLFSGGIDFSKSEEERKPSRALTTTDERGRFVLSGLRGGQHVIEAKASGHHGAKGMQFDAPAKDLRIVLPRTATVRFRFEPETKEVRARWIAARPGHPVIWVGSTTLGEILTAEDDGSFEIKECITGKNVMQFFVPGFIPLHREAMLTAGETGDLGVLRLVPGVELTGRVLGDEGRPLAGATVRILGPWAAAWELVRTDLDGRFRIRNLPPGKVGLHAAYPGYESRKLTVKDPAVVQLVRATRSAAVVTVVNSAGVTRPGVRLRFHYPDGQGGFKRHVWREENTDATGQAWFHFVPGKYRACLVRHSSVSVVVEVKKGETTRYRLVQPD